MNWVLLSLILWGAWGFLPKVATKYVSSGQAFILEVIGGVIVATMAAGFGGFNFEITGCSYAYAAGLCSCLGALLYLIILEKGEKVSLAVSITGLYPAIAVFLGILILGEQITLKRWIGVFFAGIAMVLLNLPEKQKEY